MQNAKLRLAEETVTSVPETSPAPTIINPRPRVTESARRPEESRQATGGPLSPVQFLRPKSKFKCQNTSDCHNGGVCTNETCFCSPGFTGESCSIDINECRQEQEPCLNNGTCIDGINEFRCECMPGYRGDYCQETIDMCEQSPCQNGARCVNHRVNYTCECELGWDGKHCERNIDECLRGPCQNNATCYDLTNDYRCDCGVSGYTGKNCDIDIDDCAQKPCSYGAKECIDMLGDFKCICHDGFEGKRCEEDIDECRTNPCENNSTCVEKSIHLRHLHNFSAASELVGSLAHDIRDSNLTSASGGNFSQLAGYTCECKEEFYGDRCEEKKKCYTKSVLELCGHLQAECQNVGGSYDCVISSSFDGSGHNYASLRVNGEFKMREIYVKYRSLTGGIIMSFETSQAETPNVDLQLNKSGLYLGGNPIKRDDSIKFEELLDGNEREIRLGLDTPTEIKSITLARSQASLLQIAPPATGSGVVVAAAAASSMAALDHYPAFKGCLMQVKLNNQLIPFIEYGSQLLNNGSLSGGSTFELLDKHLDVGMCRTCFEQDCKNHGSCETQDGYDHCSCTDNFTGNYLNPRPIGLLPPAATSHWWCLTNVNFSPKPTVTT